MSNQHSLNDALSRMEAEASEARGDVAFLIVKGSFLLFWPLALGIGWLAARFD